MSTDIFLNAKIREIILILAKKWSWIPLFSINTVSVLFFQTADHRSHRKFQVGNYFRSSLVQLPAHSNIRSEDRRGCSGLYATASWKTPRTKTAQHLWKISFVALLSSRRIYFSLISSLNLTYFSFWPLFTILPLCTTVKSLYLTLINFLQTTGRLLLGSSWNHLFFRLRPSHSTSSSRATLPVLT